MPERFELGDQALGGALGVAAVEVVASEVAVKLSGGEHVPAGADDRVLDSAERLLVATAVCVYTREEGGYRKLGCARGKTRGGRTLSIKTTIPPALRSLNKFRLVFFVPGTRVTQRSDRAFGVRGAAAAKDQAPEAVARSSGAGYPDGTGDLEYNTPFMTWIVNSGWRAQLNMCAGTLRETFIKYYRLATRW